jgi:hypothetical protein
VTALSGNGPLLADGWNAVNGETILRHVMSGARENVVVGDESVNEPMKISRRKIFCGEPDATYLCRGMGAENKILILNGSNRLRLRRSVGHSLSPYAKVLRSPLREGTGVFTEKGAWGNSQVSSQRIAAVFKHGNESPEFRKNAWLAELVPSGRQALGSGNLQFFDSYKGPLSGGVTNVGILGSVICNDSQPASETSGDDGGNKGQPGDTKTSYLKFLLVEGLFLGGAIAPFGLYVAFIGMDGLKDRSLFSSPLAV